MNIQPLLQHPEAIRFPENLIYKEDWQKAGGRVTELATGHQVLYGQHGHRILMADPEGHPLHECLWAEQMSGIPRLVSARMRLDWGQWVGIKPTGLVNAISLDLSRRPGWEQLTRVDLRAMAARAMNVDAATIQFFYRDEDLELSGDGQATIRQVKDAFYVLKDGSFEGASFMSCMSRMEWGRIDYLPVVELFLSLLPGTGSATFELIRGLYDDQQIQTPVALQYRGIPAYPSVGAFRLFSGFFTPSTRTDEAPQDVFLDINRSHEVDWLPSAECPVRHIDDRQKLTVTILHHKIQKITLWDDASGLSYLPTTSSGMAKVDGRGFRTLGNKLHLHDGELQQIMNVKESWQLSSLEPPREWTIPSTSWRACFPQGVPTLAPSEAFSAVLLYPDDSRMIGEKESQPFIFDYLDDFLEAQLELRQFREMAEHIFLARCEASLGSCLKYSRQQRYTIWYEWPAFAQKHAQSIWNTLIRNDTLSWLPYFQFLSVNQQAITAISLPFDWMNVWIPFAIYDDEPELRQWSWFLANHLVPGGIGCVAGPEMMGQLFEQDGLSVVHVERGESLPTFKIHQAILQAGKLHPGLMVWIIQQS